MSNMLSHLAFVARKRAISTLYNGLVAYYPFDTNANDTSGNGNNGSVNGATLTTSDGGKIKECYNFDGTNDYISAGGTGTGLNFTDKTTFSVSMWFRITSLSSNRVLYAGGGTGVNRYPDIGVTTAGALLNRGSNNASGSNTAAGAISINTWYHVVSTGTGKTTTLYVNGEFVSTYAHATVNNLVYHTINIGRRGDNTAYTPGKIDEVGIWNRVLTSGEVTELYNSGAGKQL